MAEDTRIYPKSEVKVPALREMSFHGDRIITFEYDGMPFVAMRPIVESLGLSWKVQHDKLLGQRQKYSCIPLMVDAGGQRRNMTVVPVAKLPLWLASVNPNKIKDPERRAKIELYQVESAIALHNYWTKGVAVRGDHEGVVSEMSPALMQALGGMFKGIVAKAIRETLPAMVGAEMATRHGYLTREGMTVGQLLDKEKAAVQAKGKVRRGLISKSAAQIRKYCERNGVVPREASLGNSARAYVYPIDVGMRWLDDEGRIMIRDYISAKSGQGSLNLVAGGAS